MKKEKKVDQLIFESVENLRTSHITLVFFFVFFYSKKENKIKKRKERDTKTEDIRPDKVQPKREYNNINQT